MSSSGFSFSGQHSFSSNQSFAAQQSFAAGFGNEGFDGRPANPMLVQGLNATRAGLLSSLTAEQAGQLYDLQNRISMGSAGSGAKDQLPNFDDAQNLPRLGAAVRAALLQFELISGLRFEMTASHQAMLFAACAEPGKEAALLTITRPNRAYFLQQVERVLAQAPLRDVRSAEILSQVEPPIAYFASILNLQVGRHQRTLELLNTALQFSFAVSMRFKQAFAAPRPGEYSSQIQPMIEAPMHASYPAGHALEGHVSAAVLGRLAGDSEIQGSLLRALADRIAENRIVAGLHFPVDCRVGRLMGDALAAYFLHACGNSPTWTHCTFDAANFDAADARTDFKPGLARFQDDPKPATGGRAREMPLLAALWQQAQAEWR